VSVGPDTLVSKDLIEMLHEDLLSEHAAMCSIRCEMRWLVKEPNAFPLIGDRSEIFRSVN
jgi:hypothetical protein